MITFETPASGKVEKELTNTFLGLVHVNRKMLSKVCLGMSFPGCIRGGLEYRYAIAHSSLRSTSAFK